jgi:hypothetical protein
LPTIKDAPSFANTIEALEQSGKSLDKVLVGVFFSVAGADSNEAGNVTARIFSPKLDHPVAVADRAVPAVFAAPRSARRPMRAWAARGANGGETDNRAIAPKSWPCAKSAPSCWAMTEFRGLQAGNRDGRHAGRVRDLLMAVWDPGQGRGRGRCRRADEMMMRRWRQRPAGAVGLALLRRKAAQGGA